MVDLEVLIEAYTVMKEYVPSKDRQAAADQLVSIIADFDISEKDLKEFCSTDKYLQNSIKEYLGESDDDEGYDDYE